MSASSSFHCKLLLGLSAAFLASAASAADPWPTRAAPTPDAALDARVRAIVAGMTLEQKVGQITQADIRSVTPDDVRKYYLGSVLNGGGAWPG
ncbi:MAG TPA: 1,4-beta-D-glucan glucohydrolase, partial [Sphingomicrobium sp.]|nr:1,4-beta-D-glucan glucohydrolase [Sphingomicrobium sp.]